MKTILSLILLISAPAAWAIDVCSLANQPIDSSYSATEISDYQQKLNQECSLSQNFKALQSAAQQNFGIQLTQISSYQAIRYVQRKFYDFALHARTPVPLIYQRYRSMTTLPLAQRSSEIWDNWQAGIRQLDPARNQLLNGNPLTIPQFQNIHRGFFTLSDETGDFAHPPQPGVLKTPYNNDAYWWKLSSATDAATAQPVVDSLNERYQQLGLIQSGTGYLNLAISIRPIDAGLAVYTADSRVSAEHFQNLLDLVNRLIAQAQNGEPMHVQQHLITPGELAYLAQQFFVQTHPFVEGNGRTSRFLQELILTTFELPHGASGDLMDNDALTRNDEYYQLALRKNSELLDQIKICITHEYPRALHHPTGDITRVDSRRLSYQCQILTR